MCYVPYHITIKKSPLWGLAAEFHDLPHVTTASCGHHHVTEGIWCRALQSVAREAGNRRGGPCQGNG